MSDRLAAALAELVDAIREEVRAEAAPSTPRAYSIEEAADMAGLGRTYMYREANAGRLRVIRRGRRVLVTDSALRDYLDESVA